MSAQDRGWGTGWPSCQRNTIINVTCGGLGLKLPVRTEIAPLVAALVHALEAARGRPFRPDWSWGYACRAIDGTNTPSNHSWGLAIDLDAPENPRLAASTHKKDHPLRKTFPGGLVLRSTMPDQVHAIAQERSFGWGGLYTSKPDPMHFEFLGTPADALGQAGQPAPPRTYIVRSGDTLSKIGQRLGIPWRTLATANNIPPPNFVIRPGQVLWF